MDENLNGWNAAFAANFLLHIGLVMDFSGDYGSKSEVLPGGATVKTKFSRNLFLVGPQFSFPQVPRVTPLAHILFGVALDSRNVNVGITSRRMEKNLPMKADDPITDRDRGRFAAQGFGFSNPSLGNPATGPED